MEPLPSQVRHADQNPGSPVESLPEVAARRKAKEFFVPAQNKNALLAYYCSIFALIPGLGLVLGPVAQILGIMGLCKALMQPEMYGAYHAIVSIALGMIATIVNWVVLVLVLLVLILVPGDVINLFIAGAARMN